MQIIADDIIASKEFHEKVSELYRLGGNGRRIFKNVQSLLGGIKEEGARTFRNFKTTNHGESRIKSCIKYDLGAGFRLVTVNTEKMIWLLFVGNHDAADKWLDNNSGWTPIRAKNGGYTSVRNPSNGSVDVISNRPLVPGSDKLYERFEDPSYADVFLEMLSGKIALKVSQLDGNSEKSHIKNITGEIPDEKLRSSVTSVLIALLEDDKSQAQNLIDLYNGDAKSEDEWEPEDYIQIKKGDEFISVLLDSDEYEKALNHLAQKGTSLDWLLFMHPEQARVAEKDFTGPAQLSGVSGSGKTCVAIKRALRLAEKSKDARVLLVTLNKSLVGLIRKLIALSATSDDLIQRIDVYSMFELSQKLIVDVGKRDIRLFGEETDRLQEDIDKVFREYYRCWLNNDDAKVLLHIHKILTSNGIDAESYIREEFDWIRSALPPAQRNEYLNIARAGRKFPFQSEVRQQMLEGLSLWEKKMRDVGIIDYLGLANEVHSFFQDLMPIYDHVLVDESQDFGTTELAIINKITKTGMNALFLCGDVAQSVLPKKRSLTDAGIELSGGRERIIKNYRNTRQILKLAYEVLMNNLSEEQFSAADDALEILDPQYANRSLSEPLLLKADSLSEEITYAKKHMEDLCAQNLNHNGCIVFAGFKNTEVKAYSKKIGIPVLDGNLDPLNEPIVLSDLEQAKGYEFDTVIILNCESGVLPQNGIHEDEVYRSACQFYVAMTRAKNDLYLSYHTEPSRWLKNTQKIHRVDWSMVEEIKGLRLTDIPQKLYERHDPKDQMDIFSGMTGLEFIYTPIARGLTVEQQSRLIEFVDGRGMFSSSQKMNVKWRDMRALISDSKSNPNTKALISPQLTMLLNQL
jgi:superfamily I DNA/RNA helicase